MRFTLAGEVPRMIVSGTTPWRMVPVVQSKLRDDLHAAQTARARDLFAFDEYVFVTGLGARA